MKALAPLLSLALLAPIAGCKGGLSGASSASVTPQTEEQKTLYALGLMLGMRISSFNLSAAELEYVKAGLTDSVTSAKPKVDVAAYRPRIGELESKRFEKRATDEKARAKTFLEEAAKEPGAQKLPSGLVYKTLKPGTGESPAASDTVKVHYHGTLTSGQVFDSSVQRNEPAEFPLDRVVKCWTEGVQKMKVGEKARLVCPAEIAYGDRGSPPVIPGGATLIFEVELLGIKKKDAPAPALTPSQSPGAIK